MSKQIEFVNPISTVPGGVQGSYWSGYPKSGNPFGFDLTMTSFDSDHKEASSISGVATLANYSGWVYWTRMEACLTKWNLGIMFELVKYIKRIPVYCLLDQDGGLLFLVKPWDMRIIWICLCRWNISRLEACFTKWNRFNSTSLFVLVKYIKRI